MEFMVAKLRELVHSKCETYFDAFLLFLTHPNSLLVLFSITHPFEHDFH